MGFLLRCVLMIAGNGPLLLANLAALAFLWWHDRLATVPAGLHAAVVLAVSLMAYRALAAIRNHQSQRRYRVTSHTRLLPVPTVRSLVAAPKRPIRKDYAAMASRLPATLAGMLAEAQHPPSPPNHRPALAKPPPRSVPVVQSLVRRRKADVSDVPVLIERLPGRLNRYVTEGLIRLHIDKPDTAPD